VLCVLCVLVWGTHRHHANICTFLLVIGLEVGDLFEQCCARRQVSNVMVKAGVLHESWFYVVGGNKHFH